MKRLILPFCLTLLCGTPLLADSEQVKEYRTRAESGDTEAMRQLALCYENGDGVEVLATEAKFWYAKAAEKGDNESCYHLAVIGLAQAAAEKKLPTGETLHYLRRAAKNGYAPALDAMGCLYMGDNVGKKDEKRAINCFRKAADAGHAESQFRLGMCYMQGMGLEKSNAEAAVWFRKAMEQGHTESAALLGSILLAGEGVERQEEEGVACLRKAADAGSVMAQRNLGIASLRALGISKNEENAVHYLKKAAAQGDSMAMFYLGCCYAQGIGTAPDYRTAGVLLNDALARGVAKAAAELEKLPEEYRGRIDNPLELVKAQAEWGNAAAQYQLARYYQLRLDGEETDAMEADFWMRKSAAGGHAEAVKFLKERGIPLPDSEPIITEDRAVRLAHPDELLPNEE